MSLYIHRAAHAALACDAGCNEGYVTEGGCSVHPGGFGSCRCPDSYVYDAECQTCEGTGVQGCTFCPETAVGLDSEGYPVCPAHVAEEGRGASHPDRPRETSEGAKRRGVLRNSRANDAPTDPAAHAPSPEKVRA